MNLTQPRQSQHLLAERIRKTDNVLIFQGAQFSAFFIIDLFKTKTNFSS